MRLSELKTSPGSKQSSRRVGRGAGSGRGTTAGAGHKGQKARSGKPRPYRGFEGGQMPLHRRTPKRGFYNPFRKEYAVVNIGALQDAFEDGAKITADILVEKKIIKKKLDGLKILGVGELSKKFELEVVKISAQAREKVEKCGGQIHLIEKIEKKTKKYKKMSEERVKQVIDKRAAAKAPKKYR